MTYDRRFTRMRNFWFMRGALSQASPVNLLNSGLNRYVRERLDLQPDDEVLEVGCDRGHLMHYLRPWCGRIVGVDVNESALEQCSGLEVYEMSAEALRFPDDAFDKIVTLHTLEHVPRLRTALEEMARVLRPGGLMVHVYPWEPVRGTMAAAGALLAYGDIRMARRMHLHKLNPAKLVELCSGIGVRPLSGRMVFMPVPLFPSYVSVLRKETPCSCGSNGGERCYSS